jgi:hypothetical protein
MFSVISRSRLERMGTGNGERAAFAREAVPAAGVTSVHTRSIKK